MRSLSTGVAKHAIGARGNDLYENSRRGDVGAAATRDDLTARMGAGLRPRRHRSVLRQAGHDVTATDLVNWGCPNSTSQIDFLLERRAPDGVESIVTNPPFKNAPAFVEHALNLAPQVAMLLRLGFLESDSRRGISIPGASPVSTSSVIAFP